MKQEIEKAGIAGVGALGGIVAQALLKGIGGYTLHAVSDQKENTLPVPNVDFATLARECDIVIECLPATAVPDLARAVLGEGKTLLLISSCALVLYPEILGMAENGAGKILVPSGALSGLDAVLALKEDSIIESRISSTKPPKGFGLEGLTEPEMIFSGNVVEAAKAYPANVNVAATLALAGLGPEQTKVEIWADPAAKGNRHEITVRGPLSTIRASIENVPDPSNPKSSTQAALSLIAALRKRKSPVTLI